MGIYVNPGNEEFKRAVNSKIYVDKALKDQDRNRDDGKFFKVPVFLKLFLNAPTSNKQKGEMAA